MNLKRMDIFKAKTIRGATKIPTELRYRIEVRLLRRRRQIADRHVLDHAAAERADLSHRKTSCLRGGVAKNPRSSQTGGNYCDRPLTAAPAASFNLEGSVRSRKRTGPEHGSLRPHRSRIERSRGRLGTMGIVAEACLRLTLSLGCGVRAENRLFARGTGDRGLCGAVASIGRAVPVQASLSVGLR